MIESKKTLLTLAAMASAVVSFGYTLETKPGEDLAGVRDKVRAARASGQIKRGEPVTVMLAPGEYRMAGTLVFGRGDSGSADAPVVWCAKKPGTVSIVGGVTIEASAFAPVADGARLASFPPDVRDKIRVALGTRH